MFGVLGVYNFARMLDQGPQGGMDGPLDFDCYLITLAPSSGFKIKFDPTLE